MTLETRRYFIAALSGLFLVSLILVQWMETARRAELAGLRKPSVSVPAQSGECVDCHLKTNPAIIAQWRESDHAVKGVGCYDCHRAGELDADGYPHHHSRIATVVTPRDCARCHEAEAEQFAKSRHAASAEMLASTDVALAQAVEGAAVDFSPHSPTPGRPAEAVSGVASALVGCRHCHGSKVAFRAVDGGMITADDFALDEAGLPTRRAVAARVLRDEAGRPLLHPGTWPNTGMGRLNLDGSRGSCAACHSRHDFSARRARQPENCGKCHLGPDHSQREIFDESAHGVVYRDRKASLGLGGESWVLGLDYAAAPTCATCHLSGNQKNGGTLTHDPGERVSWSNRPAVSLVRDTDALGAIVLESDPEIRRERIADPAEEKRYRMKEVCTHCHTLDYVRSFYSQYDDLVLLYNEKFAKPGTAVMATLAEQGLLTPTPFDEEIEWTWFDLWHEAGRRARHGASMMAPEYSHRHGMREVAHLFYMELLPQARTLADRAEREGSRIQASAVRATIDELLSRPEHAWLEDGIEGFTASRTETATVPEDSVP